MEKDLLTLENKLSELNKKSSFGEHILNIIKGILASAPFTGGISSLMTDYIPNTKQKRLEEFAKQVAEDLLLAAGFVEKVNFVKQTTTDSNSRPDFTILLPDGTKLNVDAKFPFDDLVVYQEAKSKRS